MVRDNFVTLHASSTNDESLEGRKLIVAFRTMQVGHGRRPYDRDAFDWPPSQLWWNQSRDLEYPLELGVGGGAVIRNLPPGLIGLDLWSDDEPRRLLAEVGPFTGVGEERTVFVTL